ncbi:MAG: DUF805 domain-containing protein [Brachymonas sp.]|nr:DUF805 domain-containing protein [Brachymonas sp.]
MGKAVEVNHLTDAPFAHANGRASPATRQSVGWLRCLNSVCLLDLDCTALASIFAIRRKKIVCKCLNRFNRSSFCSLSYIHVEFACSSFSNRHAFCCYLTFANRWLTDSTIWEKNPMTSTRKTWWYAVGQEKIGPCSGSELIDLVPQGKLFPDTLVWKEGMPNWVPASRIKGLWQKLPANPPAVPPLPASTSSIGASGMPIPPMPSQQSDQQFGGFTPPPAPKASAWPDEEEDYEEELPAREEMTFKKAVQRCFKKYFDFSGRASRAEYWYFALFYFLVSLPFMLHLFATGDAESLVAKIGDIISLALALPNLAVSTRRLHDTGRSGWWLLIALTGIGAFVLLYWYIKEGDDGANEYGYPE